MEINISKFTGANPADYSASVMEQGPDAGSITWGNACASAFNLLDTPEKLEAMREWARSTGAWDRDEIKAWSDTELEALFVQLISGDIRDKDGMTWVEYEEASNRGAVSGALFVGVDGNVYYSLGG